MESLTPRNTGYFDIAANMEPSADHFIRQSAIVSSGK